MCRFALSFFIAVSLVGVLVAEYPDNVEDLIKFYESKGGVNFQNCQKSDLHKDDIRFNFYTRNRVFYNLTLNDLKSDDDFLDRVHHHNRTTKVLIHGWRGFATMRPFQRMVYDYLYSQNINVVSMDWSVYSTKCNLESIARDVTTVAGEVLADLMKFLLDRDCIEDNLQLVGFGVGSHIAGVAGKLMNPKINRITALEPMGLRFDQPGCPRLETEDAVLVDVIYTTQNHSSNRDFGHIVFYPEGGQHPQPECEKYGEMASAYTSIAYFRRSIVTPHAYPAKKIESAFSGFRPAREDATVSYTPDNYMGEYVDPSKYGKYYVNVKGLPLHIPQSGAVQTNANGNHA